MPGSSTDAARLARLLGHRPWLAACARGEAAPEVPASPPVLPDPSGVSSFNPPTMAPPLEAFRDTLFADRWLGSAWTQDEGMAYVCGARRIEDADAATIGRILKFCERGEYWIGGVWADRARDGFLVRLLDRLAALHGVSPLHGVRRGDAQAPPSPRSSRPPRSR